MKKVVMAMGLAAASMASVADSIKLEGVTIRKAIFGVDHIVFTTRPSAKDYGICDKGWIQFNLKALRPGEQVATQTLSNVLVTAYMNQYPVDVIIEGDNCTNRSYNILKKINP